MATIADGRTLPFDWYSNPDVLRLERERIFRSAWQYAGRADQVAEPGSFFTCDAAGVPIVVVRDKEGSLRAFLNVCRHRGSLVCEGEGRRETLQCPYHAWTYGLDGSLRAAPRTEREEGFDKSELGLVPVQVDAWGPFVFVNPDPDAPPLAEHLGELPDLLAAAGLDLGLAPLPPALDLEVQGELEGVLRELPRVLPLPDRPSGLLEGRRRLRGRVRARAEPHLLDAVRARARGVEGRLRPRGPIERGQFHFLWPNITINVMPGQPNLSIGPVVPLTTERTGRFLDYFVGPNVDDAWIADMLEFDDQVGAEDTVLVERVQKGLRSGGLEHGRLLLESERLLAHFQNQVVAALA